MSYVTTHQDGSDTVFPYDTAFCTLQYRNYDGAKIDVNKTSNGFALTGLCVNMRGMEPYVVAYNAFISTAISGTLMMPTAVKQHNLYSL